VANGAVQELVVRSALGGNLRVRAPNELVLGDGTPLASATGQNPNPLFATPTIKDPLISSSATLGPVLLDPTFVYDLPTETGTSYRLVAAP
jgi:alpha-L-fucosidase 2